MSQAGGGVETVWRILSWHTFGPLELFEQDLNMTAYLSIDGGHVHASMSSSEAPEGTKLRPSQTGFLNMTVSHQISAR